MRGGPGIHKSFIAVALAAAFVVSSFDTAWTVRTASFRPTVDPSLRAGEVALVHTTAGHAGALSSKLQTLGAVEIRTAAAADTVIARLSDDALAAIKVDPTVTLATTDIAIVATGGGNGAGYENPTDDEDNNDNNQIPRTGTIGNRHVNTATPTYFGLRASLAWTRSTGAGVTVAVMDSGIADHPDLAGKIAARADFVNDGSALQDPGGHGTFIAGVIAANGRMKGVAPDARLVSLRVLSATGRGTISSVIRAFSWLLQNKTTYHIDVVNLSFGAPQATSYHKDLLAALAESAWFSGITVVAAAGNAGPAAGTITTPGSDPFVITAGSFDDHGSLDPSLITVSTFSASGPTLDGFTKPDTLAPGEHVLSLRAAGVSYLDSAGLPIGTLTDRYIHMSGTSASAAHVSGVAALVLAANHDFKPTNVKGAILASGRAISGATTAAVDPLDALTRTGPANVGLLPSRLLMQQLASVFQLRGISWERLGVSWERLGVSWELLGLSWEAISWEAISWEAISWETVAWETVAWEGVSWEGPVAK
jgi:subtilisin family serine protease